MNPVLQRSLRRCAFLLLPLAGLIVLVLVHTAHSATGSSITIDGSVKTHQSSASTTITSGAFSTTTANDLIVAFIASDGPNQAGGQTFSSVAGAGLTWKLAERSNSQPGTAEVWEAVAPSPLTNVTVSATRSSGAYAGSIDVVALAGADTSGAGGVGSGSASSGAPSVTVNTTAAGSWVWGVGNDWSNATARTTGTGQTQFDQFLATGAGDTYWVQSQSQPGNSAGGTATLNDTAPTGDRYDFAGVEIRPAVVDTQAPTAPSNLAATNVQSNSVALSWGPSSDNVAVAGYDILRNGTIVGTSTSTSYSDATVSPSTSYTYTVEAYDAAGNVSPASNAVPVTTPAPANNPPVISGVTTSGINGNSATVSWTTDVPSSSQVFYGTTSSYGQSTTLDTSQVTNHSQTLTGLTPGTTYHFDVQSAAGNGTAASSSDSTFTTQSSNVTPPDMQMEVPTDAITVGTNSTTHVRQLQFTHVSWDAGTGPFELDPTYNKSTGVATFKQAIYKSTSPGVWTLDHTVPIAVNGVFTSPDDYAFPLTKFTLNNVNSDGSIGNVVATSPKTDYCMTGDTYVGGVPNTPNQTEPPGSNCEDPTKPLGWSVGWGDEYDNTDDGQPIDLTGVPDGTYILRGVIDPEHVLTESDPSNNVTDTKLQISGNSVTVLSQTNPRIVPPTVSMASPADGATVSGTTTLSVSATAAGNAGVVSVQYLLDGEPLGNPVTSAPYSYQWAVGSTAAGNHTLSAQVTDSNGSVATATPVTVSVQSGGGGGGGSDTTPPTVSITNPTNNETLSGTVPVAANASDDVAVASVQFYLDGQPLGSPVTSPPYAINWDTTPVSAGTHVLSAKATDTSGNVGASGSVTVTVSNPAPTMTCFVMQAKASVHGGGTVTTPSFHTAMPGEMLVAFVSSDGPNKSAGQSVTVSGAGLTWTLVKRANSQPGDSEVWEATAPNVLTSATVTSTPAKSGYSQDLTVIAEESVSGVGASVAASGSSGAPSASLTTQGATSLVFAVGNDWDSATARTFPSGWTKLDEWSNSASGDDYWSQYTNTPTGAAGSVVKAGDTAPTTDRWNLVAVELENSGD